MGAETKQAQLDLPATDAETKAADAYFKRAETFARSTSEAFEAAFPGVPMLKVVPSGLDDRGPKFTLLFHGMDNMPKDERTEWLRALSSIAARAEAHFGGGPATRQAERASAEE